MKKSWVLTPVPLGVETVMCPDPAADGTVVVMVVALADDAIPLVILNRILSLACEGSKFVPVIVTVVPGVPIVGLKFEIVGALEFARTLKLVALVTLPAGAVTVIGPVVAPAGTEVTICVDVAEVMVAVVPLKLTVSWLAVGLNPEPLIVTLAPTSPLEGVKVMIETWDELRRPIARMLPTAS